jgi:hypothetical protein
LNTFSLLLSASWFYIAYNLDCRLSRPMRCIGLRSLRSRGL